MTKEALPRNEWLGGDQYVSLRIVLQPFWECEWEWRDWAWNVSRLLRSEFGEENWARLCWMWRCYYGHDRRASMHELRFLECQSPQVKKRQKKRFEELGLGPDGIHSSNLFYLLPYERMCEKADTSNLLQICFTFRIRYGVCGRERLKSPILPLTGRSEREGSH